MAAPCAASPRTQTLPSAHQKPTSSPTSQHALNITCHPAPVEPTGPNVKYKAPDKPIFAPIHTTRISHSPPPPRPTVKKRPGRGLGGQKYCPLKLAHKNASHPIVRYHSSMSCISLKAVTFTSPAKYPSLKLQGEKRLFKISP